MKRTLILIPLLLFCVQAHAAVSGGPSVLSFDDSALLGSDSRDEFMKSIGIGRMTKAITSPIQKLSTAAEQAARETNGGQRFLGAKIGAVMRESSFAISDIDDLAAVLDAPIDEEAMIIDAQVEANNDLAGQIGRVYSARISVDFTMYPTYESSPTWKNASMEGLSGLVDTQINKRFGGQIKLETIDGVVYLFGTVPTENEKNVAELLVKMEPGVREVLNQIQIQPKSDVVQSTQAAPPTTTNIRNPDYRQIPRPVLPNPTRNFPTLAPAMD